VPHPTHKNAVICRNGATSLGVRFFRSTERLTSRAGRRSDDVQKPAIRVVGVPRALVRVPQPPAIATRPLTSEEAAARALFVHHRLAIARRHGVIHRQRVVLTLNDQQASQPLAALSRS
jgi:hypothetical protein